MGLAKLLPIAQVSPTSAASSRIFFWAAVGAKGLPFSMPRFLSPCITDHVALFERIELIAWWTTFQYSSPRG